MDSKYKIGDIVAVPFYYLATGRQDEAGKVVDVTYSNIAEQFVYAVEVDKLIYYKFEKDIQLLHKANLKII